MVEHFEAEHGQTQTEATEVQTEDGPAQTKLKSALRTSAKWNQTLSLAQNENIRSKESVRRKSFDVDESVLPAAERGGARSSAGSSGQASATIRRKSFDVDESVLY